MVQVSSVESAGKTRLPPMAQLRNQLRLQRKAPQLPLQSFFNARLPLPPQKLLPVLQRLLLEKKPLVAQEEEEGVVEEAVVASSRSSESIEVYVTAEII